MAGAGLQAPAVPTPQAPQALKEAAQHVPQLNWSHFKPEFSEKPEEGIKVQRICLTLVGEARLWYESLRPINEEWQALQNQFRQEYSMIGNTREQLFHMWQSFHFDENTETLDSYVTHIWQVATLLGYGEPQILDVFKNTFPTKLCWLLFPIEDLRQVVETAERILAKEKIDGQLAGQSSSTPFMSMKDSYDNKRVTFNTQEHLEDKLDRLTVMMSKLAKNEEGINK